MLIAAAIMATSVAQASVVLQIDISDIGNGNLTVIGTGANAQNNDSITTMWNGVTLVDLFTNQNFTNHPNTQQLVSATYPGGQTVSWNSSPTAGSSTLVSSVGTPFAYSNLSTNFFDSSVDFVNNDATLFGGDYGPRTFDPVTFQETSTDQSGIMGFSTSLAAFVGRVTFTGVVSADIPFIGQTGDVFTGYLDHMPLPPGMQSTSDLGYYGEKVLIGQYEVIDSSAIPEPSTYAAVFGGVSLALVILRRRNKR